MSKKGGLSQLLFFAFLVPHFCEEIEDAVEADDNKDIRFLCFLHQILMISLAEEGKNFEQMCFWNMINPIGVVSVVIVKIIGNWVFSVHEGDGEANIRLPHDIAIMLEHFFDPAQAVKATIFWNFLDALADSLEHV